MWLLLFLLWASPAWATNEPTCTQVPALACVAGQADYAGTHDFEDANLDVSTNAGMCLFTDNNGYVSEDSGYVYDSTEDQLYVGRDGTDLGIGSFGNTSGIFTERLVAVIADATDANMISVAFGGDPQFLGYTSGGTEASPTAVTTNKRLLHLRGVGYNGYLWAQGMYEDVQARQNFTAECVGGTQAGNSCSDETDCPGGACSGGDAGTKWILQLQPNSCDASVSSCMTTVIECHAGDSSNDPLCTYAGDLTISGDDLFMATNTSGYILVADGTNFNPVAMSGDVSIDGTGATALAAPGGTVDRMKYWDYSDTAWEDATLSSDFAYDGAELRLADTICENGSTTGDAQDEVYNSSACALSAQGEICIDETADQFTYYGNAASRTLDYRRTKEFTIELPQSGDSFYFTQAKGDWTLLSLTCVTLPNADSDTWTIQLQECDDEGDGCANSLASSLACDNCEGGCVDACSSGCTTTFSDSAVDDDDWLMIVASGQTGDPTQAMVVLEYTIAQE